jgi:acyl-homoserine-lactone acylase
VVSPDHANVFRRIEGLPAAEKLAALERAVARMERDWGTWKKPWGEVNRYQRIDSAIAPVFDDAAPSLPVGFASNRWGSLASFGARPRKTAAGVATRRWYGDNGNSFVAVVEFGPQVRAKAVSAGGESGHDGARHFADQAARYAAGDLRKVYLTADDLKGHVERTYHPGE